MLGAAMRLADFVKHPRAVAARLRRSRPRPVCTPAPSSAPSTQPAPAAPQRPHPYPAAVVVLAEAIALLRAAMLEQRPASAGAPHAANKLATGAASILLGRGKSGAGPNVERGGERDCARGPALSA